MLDRLGSYKTGVEFTPVRFEMNGSHVGFFRVQHSSGRIPIEGTTCAECAGVGKHSEISCEFCDGSGKTPYINEDKGRCGCCNGSGRRKNVECEICKSSGKVLGKDWGKILDHLLAAPRDALRVGPLGTHTTDLRKTIASHHSYLLKRLFERVWMVFY
ncbi:MAG: hypothetical protein Q8P93_03030 [bacterium]|nr:hypothetical protein [bacterium]